ncbi:hypothetical protein PRZ48_008422 [Zasmidium cellare]|uniref:Siderophore iron transporter mirB n=1 Tax=Zasmidium cellare TaxID=395010 RepID=A0ABR0EGG6_ZASCE|nr:hypothetical protein PRZ48_008422 [Zasmidium cellare]
MSLITAFRKKLGSGIPATTNNENDSEQTRHRAEKEHGESKAFSDPEVAERSDIGKPTSEQLPSEDVQDGVRQVEALTLVWTKTSLGAAYILMFLLYFVRGFQASITGNLSAYITSDFESHSLLPVIAIVTSVMGAATYMPLAKILNLWDRSIGFTVMTCFAMLGLILSATCNNIETYCAAQVFYTIGFTGMIFSIDVITADTSSLRDRGLAYAFTSSPYIITAFAGPAASEKFYQSNWRWGYGAFAIILPIVALPYIALLRYNRHLAKKQGLLVDKERSGRSFGQSVWYYAVQFDLVGTFLLAAGLVLILLPFTIAESAESGWRQGYIIAMLVLGLVCLVAFALAERYIAPVPFLPWDILVSRTVIGACLVDAMYQISYYCWNDYYTSYLQVVFGTSIQVAGYISSIFDVVSGLWLFVVGFAIMKTGRYRWILFVSVPVYILFEGLMIYFRQPGWSLGYQIMCQIFIAFAGGAMIIVQQVAVQAAADHNNVATALAVLNCFGNIGGAVGSSVSGAIWTHTLPDALQRLLPDSVKPDWESIYDSLDVQLSYERGTPARNAIEMAYAVAQSRMLIAGTCIMGLSLVWMFVMRDIKVTRTQTKGVLF